MKSIRYIFILSAIFASIAAISSDLYLPSFPAIANGLNTTISLTQLSLTTFVFGVAVARLTLATISDALGRKNPLIVALIICLAGCICCLFATNIYVLLVGRLLQGYGAGGSNVLGRVILCDKVKGTKLAKYSSYYSMFVISLMAATPLLGGYLQHYFGWRASFMVLLLYTIMVLAIGIFLLPETNVYRHTDYLKLSALKANFQSLFACKRFVIYAFLLMLAYGSVVAWLTSGPVVLQKIMLLSPIEFGWCAGLVGFSYILGAYINSKLVDKLGFQKMLRFGIGCFFVAAIIMLIPILAFHYISTIVFVAPVMLAFLGLSLILTNSYAAGLTLFPKSIGIAAAVLGSIQISGGFISSTIISLTPENNQLPLGSVLFIASLVCLILLVLLKGSMKKEKNAVKNDFKIKASRCPEELV